MGYAEPHVKNKRLSAGVRWLPPYSLKTNRMTPNEYKTHFFNVAKRVEKIDKKYNQCAVGFDKPVSNFELIGYFHKTRIHRTKLTLKDFAWLRYLVPAGEGIHYAEGELCQNGQVIKKVVVLREV